MARNKSKRHTLGGKDGRFRSQEAYDYYEYRDLSYKDWEAPREHPLEQILRRDYDTAQLYYQGQKPLLVTRQNAYGF
jgi:hypothetical protein